MARLHEAAFALHGGTFKYEQHFVGSMIQKMKNLLEGQRTAKRVRSRTLFNGIIDEINRIEPDRRFGMRGADLMMWASMLLMVAGPSLASAPLIQSVQKISDLEGGFGGGLDDNDRFGNNVAHMCDLDGDGVEDLAVGAIGDDDGGEDRGAVWILFMNTNGTVKDQLKISDGTGGMPGDTLTNGDLFGSSLANLGDMDGNGICDLAVGAQRDDQGGADQGAIWILFLESGGTVGSFSKIGENTGEFTGVLDPQDAFGHQLDSADIDGDGTFDLLVGALGDDDGGNNRGAVWTLFLNPDGTVREHQKISDTEGGFGGVLNDGDQLGTSVAILGDVDGVGGSDWAYGIGAQGDDDVGAGAGAVWIIFVDTNGVAQGFQKITEGTGGFTGDLDVGDEFGRGVAAIGDLDSSGVPDLAVCAQKDDDGGTEVGAVWLLFLKDDGTVDFHKKISATAGGFPGNLDDNDAFGTGISLIGDLNEDGNPDIVATAHQDDDGGENRGAAYVLFLGGFASSVTSTDWQDAIHFDFFLTNPDPSVSVDGFQLANPRVVFPDPLGTDTDIDILSGGIGETAVVTLPPSAPDRWVQVNELTGDPQYRREAWWFFPSTGPDEATPPMNVALSLPVDTGAPDAVYELDFVLTSGSDVVRCGVVQFACNDVPTTVEEDDFIEVERRSPFGLKSYPNPASGQTTIVYELRRPASVELAIVDVAGRVVRALFRGRQTAGAHRVVWDRKDEEGRRVPAGVYYSKLRTLESGLWESRRIVVVQ